MLWLDVVLLASVGNEQHHLVLRESNRGSAAPLPSQKNKECVSKTQFNLLEFYASYEDQQHLYLTLSQDAASHTHATVCESVYQRNMQWQWAKHAHLKHRQIESLCKFEIPAIVAWHRHDCP